MSKINQIQNELQQMSGEAFQKLADAYLHKRGYEQINSLGAVIGADKVRTGTPDTLVPLPNGKYVFAEYTTESDKKKRTVYKKLKDDLGKCFDVAKTGISIDRIQEIVLCHTSTLTSDEYNSLREECQKHGVNLNIFGIEPISYDLYQKYPGIARDFLGVEIDTGQIVNVTEFVGDYDKKAGATPLNTAFYFRQKELEQVLQDLESNNLVILFGKAGVGKSRLAIECCNRYSKSHPEFKVRCIRFRGPDLFEDLRVYFSESGNHLIFVDDATRINSFEYFIQLLHDQREDQQIKIIATVRDYALDKVRKSAKSYIKSTELELNSLDEDQIKQILRDEYGILNPLYLDRIADIAQGNPRLAVMAALVAKQQNKFDSINDVSNLYDEYYCSIRADLQELGDESILKTAGIIAFFRMVDHSNEIMMEAIEEAFEIEQEDFWRAARQLYDYELVDMDKNNEIVRVSDQILATYLFYLAFFKERLLNFGILLKYFFPKLQHRLVDALNPVLSAFDSKKCIEIMRPYVDREWKAYKNSGDETDLMHFIQVFWFLKTTDILIYVRDCISKMEAEPVDLSKLEIKSNSNIPSLSLLKTLGLFSHSDESSLRIALDLVLNYATKRSAELSQVLYLLTERFGFDHDSYRYGFAIQRIVIDILWKRVGNGSSVGVMLAKLFLAVAEHYLHTNFNATRIRGRATINIFEFTLPSTPELIELRQVIWQQVFHLYDTDVLKEDVLNLLHKYSASGHNVSAEKIIAQDSAEVLPFIQSKLDASSYFSCLVVQDYLDRLEHHNIQFNENLRDRFTNKTYALSEVLISNRLERRRLNLEFKEYDEFRQKRIQDFCVNYTLENYKQFFEQCLEIQQETDRRNHNLYYLPGQVAGVLAALADRDSQLYTDVIEHYICLGDPLKLNDLRIVNNLIEILGIDNTYEILDQSNYESKQKWLFDFYCLLPEALIRNEHLDQLYELYEENKLGKTPNDLSFVLKYRSLDSDVLIKVIEILLENNSDSSNRLYPLLCLFRNRDTSLLDLFEERLDVLKRAYFQALETDWHMDDAGRNFAYILSHDSNFIFEYIDWIFQQKKRSYHFDNVRDYSFLWRKENYEQLMAQVTDYIYKQNQEKFGFTYLEPDDFFMLMADGKDNEILWGRQDQLLAKLIKDRCDDVEFIQFVFDVIKNFSDERRHSFIALFLKHNKNFEDFEKISLEPSSWSSSGSWVPVCQKRIEYLESLLPLLNTVDFLKHKQHIEQHIQWLHEDIEREKKSDFMED